VRLTIPVLRQEGRQTRRHRQNRASVRSASHARDRAQITPIRIVVPSQNLIPAAAPNGGYLKSSADNAWQTGVSAA
jgi:hypothetical protein